MKKIIPNTITLCNLLSGIVGILFVHQGNLQMALGMMIAAAIFDFFDGLTARALGVSSDLGKELDSLSDCTSFGVLPSLILLQMAVSSCTYHIAFCYSALLIAAISALRLAKFNIDTRQSSSFIGLPTPAAAIFVASFCVFGQTPEGAVFSRFISTQAWAVPAIAVLISYLLVAEVPMFCFKFKKDTPALVKTQRIIFILCAVLSTVPCFVWKFHPSFILFATFACYIIINLATLCFSKK